MPTVKEEFGFLPTSVWHLTKGDFWRRHYKDVGDPSGDNIKTSSLYYGHTQFNPILAERVYLYWSNENDLVLDPFAGRTTRGLVARMLQRRYEGYEIAPLTYQETKDNLVRLDTHYQMALGGKPLGTWSLYNDDGTELKRTPDNIKDLIFTCSPYWNLEEYERCIGQLSSINDYSTFMNRIKQCAENCYRVLKAHHYCIWVVADFRKEGKLYTFHNDLIQTFKFVGFRLHDLVINILNSPVVIGAEQAKQHRITLKTHEYILVWVK